jgi:hypothetical protein
MPRILTLKSGLKILLTEKIAAVDYETDWSAEYSVSEMSYYGYTHDPRFCAHTVSIVADDFEWVGNPKDAPWERIRDHVWVSHNTPFDWSVHNRLKELGIVPDWDPIYWGDSLALCAYIKVPRALAKAVNALYGIKHSKQIRDKDSKGKTWAQFGAALQEKMRAYALVDSRLCRRIWVEHIHLWPSKELRISDLIAQRGLRGVCINREGAEADMVILKRVIWTAEQKIPWAETGVILSPTHLAAACREQGIEPPPSLDMKDEDCAAWEDKYGDQFPWVGAMRDWRRMNALLKKYEMIVSRIKADGRAEFSLAYLGTHTGRTAAGEKSYGTDRKTFNMLNLPRSPFFIRQDFTVVHTKKELKQIDDFIRFNKKIPDYLFAGIDLRSKIIPGPGNKFVICDMAQIEARITNWLGRDEATLALIRGGMSVYDAHAIRLMGYVPVTGADGKPISLKKADPGLYALAKARELALGFQAGHVRFIVMAPTYISEEECKLIFEKPITDEQEKHYLSQLLKTRQKNYHDEYPKLERSEQIARVNSQIQVQAFRKSKKWLPELWRRLGDELNRSVGGTHSIELPSGRVLQYFDVTSEGTEGIKARTERGGPFKYFYGGKLLENTVQATARDVFVDGQIKLDEAGIDVVLDIYDENLTEVPLDFNGQLVADIMCQNPSWAKTLPLGAEIETSMFYKK